MADCTCGAPLDAEPAEHGLSCPKWGAVMVTVDGREWPLGSEAEG